MKRVYLLIVFMFVNLALAACGTSKPQEITVKMKEFTFEPATITLKAGQPVRLTLVNEGALTHEMLIGRNAGEGYEVDLFDRDGQKVTIESGEKYEVGDASAIAEEGWHVEVEPGGKVTLNFTVPEDKAGEWEMGCFLDQGVHYQQGMHAPVTIEK